MITEFTKPFNNDVKNIPDVNLCSKIEQAVVRVEEARTLRDIPNLRKLKGYREGIYYRIKVRSYRIGITIEGGLVVLARCLPRKDFYKFFP